MSSLLGPIANAVHNLEQGALGAAGGVGETVAGVGDTVTGVGKALPVPGVDGVLMGAGQTLAVVGKTAEGATGAIQTITAPAADSSQDNWSTPSAHMSLLVKFALIGIGIMAQVVTLPGAVAGTITSVCAAGLPIEHAIYMWAQTSKANPPRR